MGQRDGRGHQFGSLIRGVAEHHALVAGTAGVHALGNVARLFVDRRDDGAGVGVEAVEGIVVADGGDDAADKALEIDVGLGGDFTGDDHQAGGREGLGGDAAVGILLQAGVENGVGDLVGNLVGMAFGHGFRGKQETVAQCRNSPPIAGNSIWAAWSEDRFTLDHRRGDQELLSRIGPTLAQETPTPSDLRLGMHCSMVIAASVWGQSLAVNGRQRQVR